MNNMFSIIILFFIFIIFTKNLKKEQFSDSDSNIECEIFQDLLTLINEPNLLSNNIDLINIELEIFDLKKQTEIKEMLSKDMNLDQIKEYYKDCTKF